MDLLDETEDDTPPLLDKIFEYESDDESESEMLDLTTRARTESKNEGTYLLRNKPSIPVKNIQKKMARASVVFSIEDGKGNIEEYLGLLDTGSTGSLINSELVEKYSFECKNNSSTWDTNAGNF